MLILEKTRTQNDKQKGRFKKKVGPAKGTPESFDPFCSLSAISLTLLGTSFKGGKTPLSHNRRGGKKSYVTTQLTEPCYFLSIQRPRPLECAELR